MDVHGLYARTHITRGAHHIRRTHAQNISSIRSKGSLRIFHRDIFHHDLGCRNGLRHGEWSKNDRWPTHVVLFTSLIELHCLDCFLAKITHVFFGWCSVPSYFLFEQIRTVCKIWSNLGTPSVITIWIGGMLTIPQPWVVYDIALPSLSRCIHGRVTSWRSCFPGGLCLWKRLFFESKWI